MPTITARLEAVTRQTAGVRRWGAASLDFAFLAAGRYDAFFEYGLAPWDVAAGLLLVREAGGIVSDVAGKPYELGGPSLLASNFGMHEPMIGIWAHGARASGPLMLDRIRDAIQRPNSPQDMHFGVLRRRPLVEQAPAIGYP